MLKDFYLLVAKVSQDLAIRPVSIRIDVSNSVRQALQLLGNEAQTDDFSSDDGLFLRLVA